jgi:hypothetical protein
VLLTRVITRRSARAHTCDPPIRPVVATIA